MQGGKRLMSEQDQTTQDRLALQTWATSTVECGRAAWPELSASEDELIRAAELCRFACVSRKQEFDLRTSDAAEIYLAVTCARGDPAALRALRKQYFDPVIRTLRCMGIDAGQCDDVWQILCVRLLVTEAGTQPRIVRYARPGNLKGLVRVVAIRAAMDLLKKQRWRVSDNEWLGRLADESSGPELHAMKNQHVAGLKDELEVVVAGLSARERTVLRLHLIERLGIDAIASICSVHRATAARALTRAKARIVDELRARLVYRWKVAPNELPALGTLVADPLDLNLARLLAS
jgi:RNA polymerase sigma-70 factor (ECF subfamily)